MFPLSFATLIWRLAETRAVNRSLRNAYGIGFRSIEEVGTA
jgi:hypothetical protein